MICDHCGQPIASHYLQNDQNMFDREIHDQNMFDREILEGMKIGTSWFHYGCTPVARSVEAVMINDRTMIANICSALSFLLAHAGFTTAAEEMHEYVKAYKKL